MDLEKLFAEAEAAVDAPTEEVEEALPEDLDDGVELESDGRGDAGVVEIDLDLGLDDPPEPEPVTVAPKPAAAKGRGIPPLQQRLAERRAAAAKAQREKGRTPPPGRRTPPQGSKSAQEAVTLSLLRAKEEVVALLKAEKARTKRLQTDHDIAVADCERLKGKMERLEKAEQKWKQRARLDGERFREEGRLEVLKALFGAFDDLDRVAGADLSAYSPEQAELARPFLKGVELAVRSVAAALKRFEVEPFSAKGETFDPRMHEAIRLQEDGSVPPNTVIDELRRGYTQRGQLLRPPQVIVAKAPAKTED